MTRDQALQILGLPAGGGIASIGVAYAERRADLCGRLAAAPTPGLRAKHQLAIEQLDAAFEMVVNSSLSPANLPSRVPGSPLTPPPIWDPQPEFDHGNGTASLPEDSNEAIFDSQTVETVATSPVDTRETSLSQPQVHSHESGDSFLLVGSTTTPAPDAEAHNPAGTPSGFSRHRPLALCGASVLVIGVLLLVRSMVRNGSARTFAAEAESHHRAASEASGKASRLGDNASRLTEGISEGSVPRQMRSEVHGAGGRAARAADLAWQASQAAADFAAGGEPEMAQSACARAAEARKDAESALELAAAAERHLYPENATKGTPWENFLGQRFVPVPVRGGPTEGKAVLFCMWETRVRDDIEFGKPRGPGSSNSTSVPASSLDLPIVNVRWGGAQAFCKWLTQTDVNAGRLEAGWVYRLPSDHEWSCAVGLDETAVAAIRPGEKHLRIKKKFPWGEQYPPPGEAGNYYDAGKRGDGFGSVAPVAKFPPNALGIFDLGGNVAEWCEDRMDTTSDSVVARGGSFNSNSEDSTLSSWRSGLSPSSYSPDLGYRIVLSKVTAR